MKKALALCALATLTSMQPILCMEKYVDEKNKENIDLVVLKKSSELFAACRNNDLGLVEALLKEGVNPNAADSYNQTVLHKAVASNNSDLVALLVKHNADIGFQDRVMESPLRFAVRTNKYAIVQELLKSVNDTNITTSGLNTPDKYNESPLDTALYMGNEAIAKLLLQKGAVSKKTPLMITLKRNSDDRDGKKEIITTNASEFSWANSLKKIPATAANACKTEFMSRPYFYIAATITALYMIKNQRDLLKKIEAQGLQIVALQTTTNALQTTTNALQTTTNALQTTVAAQESKISVMSRILHWIPHIMGYKNTHTASGWFAFVKNHLSLGELLDQIGMPHGN